MTNCPNCGSPIDVHECMCKYCGTYYFDLTTFEMDSDKKYYIKFKQKMINGESVIVTALARPRIENFERGYETFTCGPLDGEFIIPRSRCDINVIFSCIADPKTGELFREERKND